MTQAEIQTKIRALEKELNLNLLEDDDICEKISKQIERLRFKLYLLENKQ